MHFDPAFRPVGVRGDVEDVEDGDGAFGRLVFAAEAGGADGDEAFLDVRVLGGLEGEDGEGGDEVRGGEFEGLGEGVGGGGEEVEGELGYLWSE